jgi:AcrR family transcriptional regulator
MMHGNTDGLELGEVARRRRRLCLAALELCAEKGYQALREEEIAARAESSVDDLHRAFGDKRGLFVALLESVLRTLEARIPQIARGNLTTTEALRRMANLLSDRLRRHPGLARAMGELCLLARADSSLRAVLDHYYTALIEEGSRVIARSITRGELSTDASVRDLAWTVLTAADGLFILSSFSRREPPHSRPQATEGLECGEGSEAPSALPRLGDVRGES